MAKIIIQMILVAIEISSITVYLLPIETSYFELLTQEFS